MLNFILTPGGTLTLDYQFSSPSVSFEQLLLSGFFANRSSIPYTVDVSYELFGQNTWNYSGTLTIPGNEPVLEQYTLPLGSGNGFLGGLQILYRNPALVLDIDGSLCGFSAVPEIDPATGGSALSLVAGALAMIEQRRRRRSGSTTMA